MHRFVQIGCWELAHKQTYLCEDVYGECRDSEQALLANLSAGLKNYDRVALANLSAGLKNYDRVALANLSAGLLSL